MPTVQLDVSRASLTAPKTEILRLRRHYKKHHFVHLKQFISPDLLEIINQEMQASKFFKRIHKDIAVELCMKDGPAMRILRFVSDDRLLFRWIEQITGCEPIGCFTGRVYRMNEGVHHDDWHNDMTENRMVAMSVNLSPVPYEGGHLVLREQGKPETEQVIPNLGYGDALLFHLSYGLEHRVQNVTGENPKTAYAGWFRSKPDFRDVFKRRRKQLETF